MHYQVAQLVSRPALRSLGTKVTGQADYTHLILGVGITVVRTYHIVGTQSNVHTDHTDMQVQEDNKERYEALANVISPKGTGMPGITATLVKRNDKVAMYLRSDGYYEVGKRKFIEATEFPNNKSYPARETRWTNEDFGVIAKTTSSKTRALEIYDYFTSHTEPIS